MSAFVPGFESDLFISYAHQDDKRWVQAFEEELRDEVSRRLGLAISVWQDTENPRRRELADRHSAGHRTRRRVRGDCQPALPELALVRPRAQRTSAAGCKPDQFDDQRPLLQGRQDAVAETTAIVSSCRKSRTSTSTRTEADGPVEFVAGSRDFKRAVRKLADGIEPLLRRMRRGNQRVHVAWPVEECLTAWEQLSDELRSKGFDVQPMGPRDASFADKLLVEDMDRAVLSVHLLGSAYDQFSERLALLAADLEHQMMFWMASGAESTSDERQKAFIDAIRTGVRPDNAAARVAARLVADCRRRRPQVHRCGRHQAAAAADGGGGTRARRHADDLHRARRHDGRGQQVALDLKERICQHEKMEVFVSRTDLSSRPS